MIELIGILLVSTIFAVGVATIALVVYLAWKDIFYG